MEQKLNVLMMVSWYGPKAEKLRGGSFHYELAKGLNEFCNCAIYMPYDKWMEEKFSSEIEWGIQTYRSKYKLENKIRNRFYMYQAMKQISQEFHPDIILANVATEVGRFAVIFGKMFGLPVVVAEHSAIEASGVKKFPHHLYAKIAYGMSQYNVCVSDKLAENLHEIFPKYEFHTIYNGIHDVNDFQLTTQTSYRFEGKVNMALVAALYDKNIKGFQYLLPVMKRLKAERADIVLHVVGAGEYLNYFQNMAKKLDIEDCCIFYGRKSREEVYQIVSEMDFMVSASIFESFGCSIAEGQMVGKPAVVTRCGGLESIVNEDTGIIVEKEDEEALYQGILYMMKHYKDYDAKQLQEIARKRFSVRSVSEKYMEVFQSILDTK